MTTQLLSQVCGYELTSSFAHHPCYLIIPRKGGFAVVNVCLSGAGDKPAPAAAGADGQ